jgi:hypothetical protein
MPQLSSPGRNATASKLEQLQPANGLTEKVNFANERQQKFLSLQLW